MATNGYQEISTKTVKGSPAEEYLRPCFFFQYSFAKLTINQTQDLSHFKMF